MLWTDDGFIGIVVGVSGRATPGETMLPLPIPLLILATILSDIGPAPASSAVRQATFGELLSGSWSGT